MEARSNQHADRTGTVERNSSIHSSTKCLLHGTAAMPSTQHRFGEESSWFFDSGAALHPYPTSPPIEVERSISFEPLERRETQPWLPSPVRKVSSEGVSFPLYRGRGTNTLITSSLHGLVGNIAWQNQSTMKAFQSPTRTTSSVAGFLNPAASRIPSPMMTTGESISSLREHDGEPKCTSAYDARASVTENWQHPCGGQVHRPSQANAPLGVPAYLESPAGTPSPPHTPLSNMIPAVAYSPTPVTTRTITSRPGLSLPVTPQKSARRSSRKWVATPSFASWAHNASIEVTQNNRDVPSIAMSGPTFHDYLPPNRNPYSVLRCYPNTPVVNMGVASAIAIYEQIVPQQQHVSACGDMINCWRGSTSQREVASLGVAAHTRNADVPEKQATARLNSVHKYTSSSDLSSTPLSSMKAERYGVSLTPGTYCRPVEASPDTVTGSFVGSVMGDIGPVRKQLFWRSPALATSAPVPTHGDIFLEEEDHESTSSDTLPTLQAPLRADVQRACENEKHLGASTDHYPSPVPHVTHSSSYHQNSFWWSNSPTHRGVLGEPIVSCVAPTLEDIRYPSLHPRSSYDLSRAEDYSQATLRHVEGDILHTFSQESAECSSVTMTGAHCSHPQSVPTIVTTPNPRPLQTPGAVLGIPTLSSAARIDTDISERREAEEDSEPWDRFRRHHPFQFAHYVPKLADSGFFVPLAVDANGIVWLATHRLDGMPYALKEVPHSHSSGLLTEIACLTLGNDPVTVSEQQAEAFVACYYGCARYPLAGIQRRSSVKDPTMVFLLQTEFFPMGSLWQRILEDNDSHTVIEWDIAMQHALLALDALHRNDLIHGRPLPNCIFMVNERYYKVGNFGYATKDPKSYPLHLMPPCITPAAELNPFEMDVRVLCTGFHIAWYLKTLSPSQRSVFNIHDLTAAQLDLFLSSEATPGLCGCSARLLSAMRQSRCHPLDAQSLLDLISAPSMEVIRACQLYNAEIHRLRLACLALKTQKTETDGAAKTITSNGNNTFFDSPSTLQMPIRQTFCCTGNSACVSLSSLQWSEALLQKATTSSVFGSSIDGITVSVASSRHQLGMGLVANGVPAVTPIGGVGDHLHELRPLSTRPLTSWELW